MTYWVRAATSSPCWAWPRCSGKKEVGIRFTALNTKYLWTLTSWSTEKVLILEHADEGALKLKILASVQMISEVCEGDLENGGRWAYGRWSGCYFQTPQIHFLQNFFLSLKREREMTCSFSLAHLGTANSWDWNQELEPELRTGIQNWHSHTELEQLFVSERTF